MDEYTLSIRQLFPVGAKIVFAEEKMAYTVRRLGTRFAILTKPFNAKNTVLYTVADFSHLMRGPEDLTFGLGAETDDELDDMLSRLESGESFVSMRRWIPIHFKKILLP